MTPSRSAASRTVRAIAPTWARVGAAETGCTGTRANCPLMPKSPQSADGMRTEPPPSVQTAKGVSPAATLAAPPPLEPPDVFARFHGLRVIPVSGLSQTALQPNSLVVDLPIMQPPAALTRSTAGASKSTTLSAKGREPKVQGTPAIATRSLTEVGRPAMAPASPVAMARSASRAASSATSGVRVTKALILGSSAS